MRATHPALEALEPERAKQAEDYLQKLEEKLLALIGKALDGLSPAKFSYHRARCGFAMNRRLPTEKGFINSPHSDGPVDHDVPVLKVEGADGKLKALLFGYACHNTTLSFYEYCGDYAGFAQEFLERSHPGITALFITGCGGDQNPYPRGTLDLARHHGQALAIAVDAALQSRPRQVRGPLHLAYDMATIDYATPLPTREQLAQRKDSASDPNDRRHAERLLKYIETGRKLPESYSCPVQAIGFGDDLTLIGLPGETVVDYSLRLKRQLGARGPAVWVAGYCNDVFTYLPSKRVLEEGGYEAGGAMRYSSYPHPNPFAPTVEDRIIDKARELEARLRRAVP